MSEGRTAPRAAARVAGRLGRRGALVVALYATLAASFACAAPAPAVRAEIEFLLSAVAGSGCEFYRNGTWYDAKAATAHLRLKYDTLVQRDQIHDSTDFIDKAASQSSLSGRPYAIRCGGEAAVPTRQWFTRQLTLLRQPHPQNE